MLPTEWPLTSGARRTLQQVCFCAKKILTKMHIGRQPRRRQTPPREDEHIHDGDFIAANKSYLRCEVGLCSRPLIATEVAYSERLSLHSSRAL